MKKLIQKLFKKNKKQGTKERVNIIVFVENKFEADRYFKLLTFMLRDRVEHALNAIDRKEIRTDEFFIRIMRGRTSARGYQAHYVINMIQDEEFHYTIARPIERQPFDYLEDPKWQDLF